jgi:transcription elongation factor GreA
MDSHHDDVVFLTPEGQDRLREELKHLVEVRRPEVAFMIKEAKEAGDISENAGYDEAKDQQAFVEGRIKHLEDLLQRAQLITRPNGHEAVALGSRVTVAENGGPNEIFEIVGSAEADPIHGLISNESPLGKGLLGRKVGDVANIRTPDGETLAFKIVQID